MFQKNSNEDQIRPSHSDVFYTSSLKGLLAVPPHIPTLFFSDTPEGLEWGLYYTKADLETGLF